MSELINAQRVRTDFRRQLLTTVSALTLCGAVYTQSPARAQDADRPTVWIELGGQLERVQDKQEAFLPATLLQLTPNPAIADALSASPQRPARYAIGGEAKAIFAPRDSDWSFLAGVRYGRSNGSKRVHQQTTPAVRSGVNLGGFAYYAHLTADGDTDAKNAESHAIVDFMAGKDVGLGIGRGSTATFDFGVRFAQFTAQSTTTLRGKPDPFVKRTPKPNPLLPKLHFYTTVTHHHSLYAHGSIGHSFSGIGPSLSFTGSSPFIGNTDDGEIALDWGANAAVLFGRQKVHGNHKTKNSYFTKHAGTAFGYVPKSLYSPGIVPVGRSRSVVVPNIGGFAGLTFRHQDAKVSFGYRADFFFGAMDGGVDTRHTSTVGFYGPFATISVGLGD